MPRFFSDLIFNDIIEITGNDARHIYKVLRMSVGESLVVCDLKNYDYDCEIKSISSDKVILKIKKKFLSTTEPKIKINLFQGVPKSDKFEFITQKAVELGVSQITPVIMNRCISVIDEKNKKKKLERYNRIAFEAAKQSNRSKLPVVNNFVSFVEAINKIKNSESDLNLLFYEKSDIKLEPVISNIKPKTINIMIGPEGGFEDFEIEIAKLAKINIVSMGKRILRCETAPIFALSVLMFKFDD
ncbi:MAG: 16S rRNA (uracil(1498)-N(3))-methyltransferase [Oscillospiraceae bacterium]|nr:16S rRNA (uracil(1498)-N(3))-methyltransferase [Oscillospiraceae bacterium]